MSDERMQPFVPGVADCTGLPGSDTVGRRERLPIWLDPASGSAPFQLLPAGLAWEIADTGGACRSPRLINLATQDYLGLSQHPEVMAAAADACLRLGTHGAGSEPMGAARAEAKLLERALADYVEHEHVRLFPTGWAARYAAMNTLIGPSDHVLLDALAHKSFQEGAHAITRNVAAFAHNDLGSLGEQLGRIRREVIDGAIFVGTASLFAADSDHPNLRAVLALCRRFGAALLVDVTHDLGVLGPEGRGVLAEQDILAEVDFLVGSLAKTFAAPGGFFAARSRAGKHHVRADHNADASSLLLMPAQVAAIRESLAIVRSAEGRTLREETLRNAHLLRDSLGQRGLEVLGRSSALVVPLIGRDPIARLASQRCREKGVMVEPVELPAPARLRLQVSPGHAPSTLAAAADVVAYVVAEVRAAAQRPAGDSPP